MLLQDSTDISHFNISEEIRDLTANDIGQNLGTLGRHWADIGKTLGRDWADIGQILGKHCSPPYTLPAEMFGESDFWL